MTTEWAAKVLADVPRHNAQDAKSMTGYAASVWLHEDAVVDAIAKLAEGDGLVERLLDWSEFDEGKINDTREEAAAHIVALTAERGDARKEAGIQMRHLKVLADKLAPAEAERDALRAKVARLEGVIKDRLHYLDEDMGDHCTCGACEPLYAALIDKEKP